MLKNVIVRTDAEPCDMSLDKAEAEFGSDYRKGIEETLKESRKWGWCTVKVSVKMRGIDVVGVDYLSCCSYASKSEFLDSDYYADMVKEATRDLERRLGVYYEQLAAQLDVLSNNDNDFGRLMGRAAKALRANK